MKAISTPLRWRGSLLAILLAILLQVEAIAFPGFLRRVDSLADWKTLAMGSSGIKYIVPGPHPDPGPDGELVPGDPGLPCLDFVIYGPGFQHIDIIHATELDCVEDFSSADMNVMRHEMTQFAGYIARIQDTKTGRLLLGVTIHNDLFIEPLQITPAHVRFIMRQLRLTFNEAAIGPLVYLPTSDRARQRARHWLNDLAIEFDFDIFFMQSPETVVFLRGDADGDKALGISDPILLLNRLFVDSAMVIPCMDAADANDDGSLDLHDPMLLLRYLFQGGPQPYPPFPDPGRDQTDDEWTCL